MKYPEFDKALRTLWLPYLKSLGFEGKPRDVVRGFEEFDVSISVFAARTPGAAGFAFTVHIRCLDEAPGMGLEVAGSQVRDGDMLGRKELPKLPMQFYSKDSGVWEKRGGARAVEEMISCFRAWVEPHLDEYEGPVLAKLAELSPDDLADPYKRPFGLAPGCAAAAVCWVLDNNGRQDEARAFRQRFEIPEGLYGLDPAIFEDLLGRKP